MELISKDTAIRVVDSGRNRQQLVDMMQAVPPVNAIEIPKGATNGDMLKAMFNVVEKQRFDKDCYSLVIVTIDGETKYFDLRWWDAPYKGSEG